MREQEWRCEQERRKKLDLRRRLWYPLSLRVRIPTVRSGSDTAPRAEECTGG